MMALLRLLLRFLYGLRVHGLSALDQPGPMILAPNHVSWLDWLFIGVVIGKDWRFVTSSTTAQLSWLHRRIMINDRSFPVDPTSAYAVRDMNDYLLKGGKLVIFPEGRISNHGGLMKFYDGIGFLLLKSGARVSTCYLQGAVRLPWVKHKGWTRWLPRVSLHFSVPEPAPQFHEASSMAARARIVTWLRDCMVRRQFEADLQYGPSTVPAAIGTTIAAIPSKIALEDATFTELSYRRVAVGSDALGTAWEHLLGPSSKQPVGVLLPTVNATPLVLLSLWSTGRVPALLNFSSGMPVMLACAALADLRHVITSRQFLEKAKIDPAPFVAAGIAVHCLEDVRAGIGRMTRLRALGRNFFRPGLRLRRASVGPADTAVILFTSGSEGTPKGVELTHRNLVANSLQVCTAVDIHETDRFFACLPVFHSFGLMEGIVVPLMRGCYSFLYPTPLHYRTVPTMVYERNCTIMAGTNTFLNGYARKAHPYDFHSVRLVIAGAEKVQAATYDTWSRKFGVRIVEGYGATECSPVISANTPMNYNQGSAGRLMPGMDHRIEKVEGVEKGGRLFVRGPNVMKGYLNPEPNAAFQALNGWYDTGDLVEEDADGYLHILGRLKRFAKVSGEMVSLTALEDALAGAFPAFGPRCTVVVIALPDADKGEKLIAVTNEARLQLAQIREAIKAKGFSNLCAPRKIVTVASIPKLGSGKLDHRELQRLVVEQEASARA